MKEYKGFDIDTVPGMCCPSLRIRANGKTIHTIPFNDPQEGERTAMRWIDSYLNGGSDD